MAGLYTVVHVVYREMISKGTPEKGEPLGEKTLKGENLNMNALTSSCFCWYSHLPDTDQKHHNKKSPFTTDLHISLTHPGGEK